MGNSANSQFDLQPELEQIYKARFSGLEAYRRKVWRVLVRDFFSRWIQPNHAVLDLGCGYCEFIGNVVARERFGMDLNPSSRNLMPPGAHFLEQDCSAEWPLADESLDVVFTSNFFEHLLTKSSLRETLSEARRCLKQGGRLIAIGPNIKYLAGAYWDFFDHHIALTELSLSEALITSGYTVESAIAKFLPYTMSQGNTPPLWTLRLYLKLPFLWSLAGTQFLVVARK